MHLCANSDIDHLSEIAHEWGMADLARDPRQLGNAIRNARKKLGWNQSMLAGKAALRQETISLIETGSRSTRIDTLLAVLGALDLEFHVAPRTKSSAEDIERLFRGGAAGGLPSGDSQIGEPGRIADHE